MRKRSGGIIEKKAKAREFESGGGSLKSGEVGFAGGMERAGGGEGGAEGVEITLGEEFAELVAEGGRKRGGIGGDGGERRSGIGAAPGEGEKGGDFFDEVGGAERFGQKVVATGGAAGGGIERKNRSGSEEDLERSAAGQSAEATGEFEAVEVLHADIEDGEVGERRVRASEVGEGGFAGGELDAGEAEGNEEIGEEGAVDLVVVDDEDVAAGTLVTGEAAGTCGEDGIGGDGRERDGERKSGAAAGLAGERKGTAKTVDQSAGDGEAEAGAGGVGAGAGGLLEGLEEAGLVGGVDAGAGVGDGEGEKLRVES
jgi:hypothetical protein